MRARTVARHPLIAVFAVMIGIALFAGKWMTIAAYQLVRVTVLGFALASVALFHAAQRSAGRYAARHPQH
jgi:hypothetical protein